MSKRVELEQTIVSIILKKPDKILSTPLEARWFSKFRRVIEAMQKMSGQGIEIDAMSLTDTMPSLNLSDVVEWQRSPLGAPANYQLYLGQLKEMFISEGLKSSLDQALQSIESGESAASAIAELLSSSVSIQNANGRNHNSNAKEGMVLFVENLEKTFYAKDSGGIGLKTGLAALDGVLGGLHPSDLIVVGARPGVGKTSFMLSCALRLCRTGKRVGIFSTEMPTTQVMARLTAMVSGISAKKLRDADLDDSDWARITAAAGEIQNFKLMICDKPNITAGEIAMQSRAWAMADGLDFIAIDYLTRVKPDKPTGNQTIDVGEVATQMKNIGRSLDIPVMLLAQLNRGPAGRTDKKPRMSDLRDSGVVEQEADSVLLLYRAIMDDESAHDDLGDVIVDKNRHGELATIECRYIPHLTRWDSYDHDYR